MLDRKKGTWYAIDFEDEQFGGYSERQLEMLLQDCNFLDLIEQPGLWRNGLPWVVLPGRVHCLAHGRRQIVAVAGNFPEQCRHVLESLGEV